MGGPLGSAALLDLLEPGWRRDLSAGALAGMIAIEADVLRAAARALGDQSRGRSPVEMAREWPACLVVTLARIADTSDRNGSFWPGWHRAAGVRMTRLSADEWGQAFLGALTALGITPSGAQAATAREAVLAQAVAGDPGSPAAAEEAWQPRLRLEPFGRGVLIADGSAGTGNPGEPGSGRPALPDEVADPAGPLLAFSEEGVPVGPELPAEPVWVLYPAAAELRSDVPPQVVLTSRLPLTWRGWRLVLLDLRGVSWLELDDHDETPRRHLVRGRSKPGLAAGPPLPGVTTNSGRRVFAALPAVLLPPGDSRWRVEVRRTETGAVLADVTTAGDGWRPERLWRRAARPVLGELAITVTAADREAKPGLRRTLAVAEGLSATYFPEPRLTSDRGLEPAEAALTAPPGMTVSPQAAPLPAETAAIDVTCVARHVVQPLRVTPPHIRIRIEPEPGSGDAPTRWHQAGVLRLRTADLWHGGALSIDLPGIDRNPVIEVVSQGGAVVQVLDPTRQGRYPLRRMADTVTAHGGASLRITVGGRTATIARITAPDGTADPWINPTR